jgi:hypothetical protein
MVPDGARREAIPVAPLIHPRPTPPKLSKLLSVRLACTGSLPFPPAPDEPGTTGSEARLMEVTSGRAAAAPTPSIEGLPNPTLLVLLAAFVGVEAIRLSRSRTSLRC